MQRRWLLFFLIFSLAVVIPVAAAAPVATLTPTGSVTVNGKHVKGSTALFSGDHVETGGGNSAAQITGEGMQTVVASNTQVYVREGLVELGCGSAAFSGNSKAGSYYITADKPGKYEVLAYDGRLRVSSKDASLTITNGSSQWKVGVGETNTQALPGACLKSESFLVPGTIFAAETALVLLTSGSGPASPAVP
jgi:hypothetical protein